MVMTQVISYLVTKLCGGLQLAGALATRHDKGQAISQQ
jgi:hypothetical protein